MDLMAVVVMLAFGTTLEQVAPVNVVKRMKIAAMTK
jgi:hypothetical protein